MYTIVFNVVNDLFAVPNTLDMLVADASMTLPDAMRVILYGCFAAQVVRVVLSTPC